MNSNLRSTMKLRSLRNRLLGLLVLIACTSLPGASTARAGFFNNLLNQAENKTIQTIKHDLGNQSASQPAPASPQPATVPNSPANQPPAAKPSARQAGAVRPASASGNPGPVAFAQTEVGPLLRDTDLAVDSAPAYTVSLHGSHLASAHMQGSRYVVTVDGVTGPRVDAVLPTNSQFANSGQIRRAVAMSDDGRHYAYEASERGKIEVIDDGKQILQLPRHGVIQSNNCYLFFSPHGGAHLFFAAVQANTTEMEMWVDGKPVPSFDGYSGNPFTFTFSPDGKHYLYAGLPENRSPKFILVVDGRKMGYALSGLAFGPAPQFTADGRHVLYVRTTKYPAQTVFEDGKSVVTAAQQVDSLVTAPKGSSYAAVVTEGSGSQNAVYLNGKEVPGTRGHNNGGYNVSLPVARFSPDGKHLAVSCNYGAGNAYVVLDGQQGDTYDKIHAGSDASDPGAMKFSADSQSFGYFADAGSKGFAVVDGHEYDPGFEGTGYIYFSPEGHHVAVVGEKADSSGQVLYVDGKLVFGAPGGLPGTFAFNRDGSHWMIHGQGLVVDGRSLPVSWIHMMPCRFSPDGSEVALAGETVNGPMTLYLYNCSTRRLRPLTQFTQGNIVDAGLLAGNGVPVRTYQIIFSPDSQHLYYTRLETKLVHQHQEAIIYVDGEKTAVRFAPTLFPPAGQMPSGQENACWQVGADDKLHALCAVGNEVERITITPPPVGLM